LNQEISQTQHDLNAPVRVWGISDVHIDYEENLTALLNLDLHAYQNDALIIAGDATDDMERLAVLLKAMKQRYRWVGFIPGNHELWIARKRNKDANDQAKFATSVDKFNAIRDLCQQLAVFTAPQKVGSQDNSIWLVPLFSWYHSPEENPASLYASKKCEKDRTQEMWSDFFLTQWPDWKGGNTADYFLNLNKPVLSESYDAPVISFSHFLPLQELLMASKEERKHSDLVYKDITPEFNFSRVAGTQIIDQQLRSINSTLHLYGHQHRNRHRKIDGVTYVSHCMGYPKERQRGLVANECTHPKLLWDTQQGFY